MRPTTAILLLGALLVPGPTTTAAAAETSSPVTWSIAPATTEGPDERVSFRLEMEPGAELTEHLAVTNYSEQDVTFELAASDGVVSESGSFGLLPGSADNTGAGAWIDIPQDVAVPAGESTVVPFTIAVPADALPGDHPSGIAATISSSDEGIGLDAGVGVRIHLRVTGEIVPQVELSDVAASYATSWNPFAPGVLDLEWTVVNSGNVRLGAAQSLQVLGPLGLDPGVEDQLVAQQREVLPGQSASFTASVEAWPMARLTTRLTSTQQVVGEDAVDAALPTAVSETTVTAVPWPHLVVVLVLLLVVVLNLVRRRRSRARLDRALQAARAQGSREAAQEAVTPDTKSSSDAGREATVR